MASSRFSGKTKADLVAIARISGLLTTTKSQKMTKAELLAFLEASEASALADLEEDKETKVEEKTTTRKKSSTRTRKTVKKEEAKEEEVVTTEDKIEKKEEADSIAEPSENKEESEQKEEVAEKAEENKKPKRQSRRRSNTQNKGTQSKTKEESSTGSQRKGRIRYAKKAEIPKTEIALKKEKENEAEKEKGEEVNEKQELSTGVLEIMPDGYGFLRIENYIQSHNDLYLPPQYIRRFNLRQGDVVTGPSRQQRDNDRYQALYYVKEVNGQAPDKMMRRPHFDRLTPIYPNERFVLETTSKELSTRIIDLVAPIGKGQRGMIVSPPKAGKTVLLQKIANAISTNNPEAKLIVLLIDERPEEVTDMQRSIDGEVVYSTFDKTPENHVKITELVLERAMRLVELGQDVVILLDSITRLGRAYNLTINPTGRTLSGGLDPGALYGPKRFFGAARNIEGGGSLTIIATALVETGSRMDEVIFEEFKGTGNMEVYLDRKLSEKRIFPAIDVTRSGTRREDLLLDRNELDAVWGIRKAFGSMDTAAVTETIIGLLLKTSSNEQFISSINVSFNDKSLYESMRGSSSNGSANGNGNNKAK